VTAKSDVPCAMCWVMERRAGDVMRGIIMKPPPMPASDPASPAIDPTPKESSFWFVGGGSFVLLFLGLSDCLLDLNRF